MRKEIISLLLVLPLIIQGQSLIIPSGSSVTIDGIFTIQEWQDANQLNLSINSTKSTKVFCKHDGNALLVAFVNNLQSGGLYFPEIMIDADNNKGSSLSMNDWWFHVSATDCEFNGQYGNYNNCMAVRPNWKAEPNFQLTSSVYTDTVEISIPFSTLGVNTLDSIGISFLLNNFQTFKRLPLTSNHLDPSTWYAAQLDGSTKLEEQTGFDFSFYPNPTKNEVMINYKVKQTNEAQLRIMNLSGQVLSTERINHASGNVVFDVNAYPCGMYFIELSDGQRSLLKKIIKH